MSIGDPNSTLTGNDTYVKREINNILLQDLFFDLSVENMKNETT